MQATSLSILQKKSERPTVIELRNRLAQMIGVMLGNAANWNTPNVPEVHPPDPERSTQSGRPKAGNILANNLSENA